MAIGPVPSQAPTSEAWWKQPRGRSREDRGANMGQPLINNPPFGESWHTTNKIVFFFG